MPLFHYAACDCAEAIEVMTWVLHLENHFHIPQQRVVMIAFDKRQSKLHHLFPECSSVQTSWGERGKETGEEEAGVKSSRCKLSCMAQREGGMEELRIERYDGEREGGPGRRG